MVGYLPHIGYSGALARAGAKAEILQEIVVSGNPLLSELLVVHPFLCVTVFGFFGCFFFFLVFFQFERAETENPDKNND